MRDVLALAEHHEPFDVAVTYAAAWAARLGGMLTGLHVIEPVAPTAPVVPMEAAVVGLAATRDVRERVARAAQAAAAFDRLRAEFHVARGGWNVVAAPRASALAQYARWHDLLVLDGAQDGDATALARVGATVLAADVPCIVVPPRHRVERDEVRCVVVAWNGSVEATRALRAARPLLGAARRIVVLLGAQRAPAIPLPDELGVDRWFEREALRAELRPLAMPDDRSGYEILDVATRLDADLLVMGAWGRSRFGERLFGGATRHVLRESRIPVLMRH